MLFVLAPQPPRRYRPYDPEQQRRGGGADGGGERAEVIGRDPGGEARDRHRQRDEAVVGGEDSSANEVGRLALQAVRRDLPRRAAAEVREEDGGESEGERVREREAHVSGAEGDDAERDGAVFRVVVTRGAAEEKRAEERAEAAGGEEDSDAERAGAKDFPPEHAHHGHDAGAEAVAAFDRQQPADAWLAAGEADGLAGGLEQGRGIPRFARVDTFRKPRAHAQQQERGEEKARGVDEEGDVAAECRGDRAAEARADREHRPP